MVPEHRRQARLGLAQRLSPAPNESCDFKFLLPLGLESRQLAPDLRDTNRFAPHVNRPHSSAAAESQPPVGDIAAQSAVALEITTPSQNA
jgi:hypothetical protein